MSSFNLTLKPAQTEFVVKPGITLTQAYSLTNNGDSSVMLSTEVLPWLPAGTNGSINYQDIPKNPDFSFTLANSDLKLGQTFILRPQETRQLVLKIKTQATASPEDGYFTFFVTQDLTSSLHPDSTYSSAVAKVGSHLLISSSDTEFPVSKASVLNFTASPRIKDILFPQINFQAQIFNSSAYFTQTVGKLTITKNNLIIREFDLFPHNVLAKSSRSIACNSGNLPVACTLNPPFWPGAYTATITLDPGLASKSFSTTFFVFPFSFILGLFLIFILILSLSKGPRRHPRS